MAPDLAAEYAAGHDEGLWQCLCAIMEVHEEEASPEWRAVAQLPLSSGGLGLRSAARLSPAAFWASWADSLAMIRERHPDIAAQIVDALGAGGGPSPTLQQAAASARLAADSGALWKAPHSRASAWLNRLCTW